MIIRKTTNSDLNDILNIHLRAFGQEKGPVIAKLVRDLLDDPTALPLLSLAAVNDRQPLGHVLFTKVRLAPEETVSASILAPLAVKPEVHSQGIGGRLINEGLKLLAESGTELVFVLGHPGYYPRCGFQPAGGLGFKAPYPIPEEHADAWMVQELQSGVIGRAQGRVQVSDILNQPEHWRE